MITFTEHPDPGYALRTLANAKAADLTIAFAIDFSSAGEILTRKCAYGKYFGIELCSDGWDIMGACNDVHRLIKEKNIKSLNIAGNGIYTLKRKYTQEMLDADILLFLQRILSGGEGIPLRSATDITIRSGGQTGVDEAALKAGDILGLQTICLAPKGWLFRDINGRDIRNEVAFKKRFGKGYDLSFIF